MTQAPSLGLTTHLHTDFDTALTDVTAALKAEGFGVLTEIDMQATFKNKLDADFRPYRILGACNPQLAHRALTAASEVGLLLPCNVTVEQIEAGTVQVSIVNPLVMMNMVSNEAMAAVARDASDRMERVIAALEQTHAAL